ncbi:hypothetical protein Taro_015051 [Colocasia esculenta]|uniref:Uncharacterized protein n=1 Tax=Colocasia esculenta TaxID=4460 RepID=A0A843UGJ0_COLES|nr:hypothetical protein [Colocasia esculenta]
MHRDFVYTVLINLFTHINNVSSMETSKSGKETEEKCYMAHGSSKGSFRSDKSEESYMSEKSTNSQRSGVNAYKSSSKIQVKKNKK